MHKPKKFIQEDYKELIGLVQDQPFASLVLSTDQGIEAIHLPMILKQAENKIYLQGHIARTNTVWQRLNTDSQVLAIFNGPNCYISPNHYPTKAVHGKAVPTWNYVVVQCKGKLSFIHDVDWIYTHIAELSDEHESGSNEPWAITDAPQDYIQKMLPAIVGLEIEVSSIEGQWKLSQNQVEENKQGVIEALKKSKDDASKQIAALVEAQAK